MAEEFFMQQVKKSKNAIHMGEHFFKIRKT
jgi:hypothetical protein